jgi:asparagine synthase (glutamine-hydrolysing)
MSFQGGAFYFDQRRVSEWMTGAILGGAARDDCDPPTSYSSPGVLLAHSASELDGGIPDGPQPYIARTKTITFDGRLDNREHLLLRLRDVLRGDTSDAALALAAYSRWGSEGLAHLIGDWSLVIWDAIQKAVLLGSDFAGVRPLYYCLQRDRLLWSTHLGALAASAEANEIDDEYAAGLLSWGGCPNRTPYSGIHSVPPGHSVLVTKEGVKIQPFWKLPIGNTIRYRRESDYEDQLRALFREAVQCRLRTSAPVLAELSGGLDSSSIVCMASHLMRSGDAKTPRLVTLSYEHQGSRDTPFYTAVEQFCQVESIHASTDDFQFLAEEHCGGATPAVWEPLHTHAAMLARQAGAKTYCTGQLGDLIMGNWDNDSDQVAGLLRQGRIGSALKDALAWSKVLRIPIAWVLWRALLSSLPRSLTAAESCRIADGSGTPGSTDDSIEPGFRKRMGLSDPHRFFSQEWIDAPPERRKHFRGLMENLQLRRLQPPEPLQHLSYTHPYAHRPLVTFLLSIPADVVCRAGEPRRLMRRAFHELWPPALRQRRSKDAFGGVFLNSLRPLARELVTQPQRLQVVERGYVEAASLKKRLERLSHSLDCNEPQLRQIMLLEFWLRARESKLHRRTSSWGTDTRPSTAAQPIGAF